MNLARIKCLSQLVCAMCKVQTVNFAKLASAFDNRTSKDSSMRRIQRFMAQTVLNMDIVAKVVMKYGLEHIASVLLNPLRPQPFDIFKILSCA